MTGKLKVQILSNVAIQSEREGATFRKLQQHMSEAFMGVLRESEENFKLLIKLLCEKELIAYDEARRLIRTHITHVGLIQNEMIAYRPVGLPASQNRVWPPKFLTLAWMPSGHGNPYAHDVTPRRVVGRRELRERRERLGNMDRRR